MFLTKVWNWIKGAAVTLEEKAAPIAVAITEELQNAIKGGELGFIAKLVETIFPQVHNLPEQLVAKLEISLPKALAIELSIQALSASATQEQIAAFEQAVLDAFGKLDDKSKFYTNIGAQVFADTMEFANGPKHTFAQKVAFVEAEFQKIKAEAAAEQN